MHLLASLTACCAYRISSDSCRINPKEEGEIRHETGEDPAEIRGDFCNDDFAAEADSRHFADEPDRDHKKDKRKLFDLHPAETFKETKKQ